METHTIQYTTRVRSSRYGDSPFHRYYRDEIASSCDEFREAFEEGYMTFEEDVDSVAVHLHQTTEGKEGNQTITFEEHMEISFCPFCGAELEFEESEVIDERNEK